VRPFDVEGPRAEPDVVLDEIQEGQRKMRKSIYVAVAVVTATLWGGSALADGGDGAYLGNGAVTLDANLGSGEQINAENWHDMIDVNTSGYQLTGGAINSNGGDRNSDDVVLNMGDYPLLASAALDVEVVGNVISVGGDNSSADSSLTFSEQSGFMYSYGVTAVAINSGANASQSVSVNVMSEVVINTD